MERISKISKTEKIENNLRHKENKKEKTKYGGFADFDSMLKEERKLEEAQNNKKTNSLDAYKFEIQKSIIAQKKIAQIKNGEKEQEEK